jgi:hypothetical protein
MAHKQQHDYSRFSTSRTKTAEKVNLLLLEKSATMSTKVTREMVQMTYRNCWPSMANLLQTMWCRSNLADCQLTFAESQGPECPFMTADWKCQWRGPLHCQCMTIKASPWLHMSECYTWLWYVTWVSQINFGYQEKILSRASHITLCTYIYILWLEIIWVSGDTGLHLISLQYIILLITAESTYEVSV